MKLFLEECRLTCFGGSEKGTCECRSPDTCKLRDHPRFQHFRNEAIARMVRHLDILVKGRSERGP